MFLNILNHVFNIMYDFSIPVSNRPNILSCQILFSFLIVFQGFDMLRAIKLNCQTDLRTIEIKNIRSYTILPPKLTFFKFSAPKLLPQDFLRIGLIDTQFFSPPLEI